MLKNWVIAACFLLVISACTSVHIHTRGEIVHERYLGFINVLQPESSSRVETTFYGLGVSNKNFVAGYLHEEMLLLSDDECAVFLDNESEVSENLVEQLVELDCKWIESKSK